MTIAEIKEEMTCYVDFYGGDLISIDLVKSAKTKSQLKDLLDEHLRHLENQHLDALQHLNEFIKKLEL